MVHLLSDRQFADRARLAQEIRARLNARRARLSTFRHVAKPARFSAKGLQAQRSRIGLSPTDFGKLLGVSAQSIYNWESEKARPRPEQIAKLVALRSLGKREVAVRLEKLNGAGVD